MFNRYISNTDFTKGVLNRYFRDKVCVYQEEFKFDKTLTSVLRALLCNRLNDSTLNANILKYTISQLQDLPVTEIGLHIIDVRGIGSDSRESLLAKADNKHKGFVASNPAFKEEKTLMLFAKQKANMDVRVYIDAMHCITIVICADLTIEQLHFLNALIPRFLPWFFENNPITDGEYALLDSFTKNTEEKFLKEIQNIARESDIKKKVIRESVCGFECRCYDSRIKDTEKEIEDLTKSVAGIMSKYNEAMTSMRVAKAKLVGIKMAQESVRESSETFNYIMSNRSIDVLDVGDDYIRFMVLTTLDYFDVEMFDLYINNNNSYMHMTPKDVRYDIFNDDKNREIMLREIFSDDPVIKIKMDAAYYLDIGSARCEPCSGYMCNEEEYIHNPHIFYYDCLGNYEMNINESLFNYNIIGAIEQCIASAKSVNVVEDVSITKFIQDLFSTNKNVVVLPDGECVTTKEAFDFIKNGGGRIE